MKRMILAAASFACLALNAQAGQTISFDNPGDVTLSPTQAPGVWYTDRYAPASFQSGQTAGGRNGVLVEGISSADQNGSRPSGFNSTFYNTQGRKFDVENGTISMQIDLYVDSAWDLLNQNVLGAEGRLASFWATGVDGSNAVSSFPIIEFNNLVDTFRGWDNNTNSWVILAGFSGYDKWYTLGLSLVGNQIQYSINGVPVLSQTDSAGTIGLSNVILQGYNAGNSYNIAWDNLQTSTAASAVPEPATVGSLAVAGLFGLVGYARRRRLA